MFGIETFFLFEYICLPCCRVGGEAGRARGSLGKMEITHVVAAKNMWGNRRTGSESKTEKKQHLTTETLLNEDSGSEQTSAAEVPV